MRRTFISLLSGLAAAAFLGCRETSSPAVEDHGLNLVADSASATIRGRVVGTDSLPAAGARVIISLVGPVPPDSTPPDSTPPDSTAGPGAPLASVDSVPGDTVPPPPGQCGRRGQVVARTRANREGGFRVQGLAPGVYDLRAENRGEGTVCGILLQPGQVVTVTIMLL